MFAKVKSPYRIMLIGKNGQIGWELQRTLSPLGKVLALNRVGLDLAKPNQIRERVREIKPNIIVNAAAYTAVDRAEEEQELAMAVNGVALGILAEEAKKTGAVFIHFSTDYVFDGTKTTPYTEEDRPNPINTYGRTKLEGERAIQSVGGDYIILRTSWVYGTRGKNFLLTILRLAKERKELRVVNDQIGSPTWCRMIAEATAQILAKIDLIEWESGIYHLTASGSTSWYGFAKKILEYVSEDLPHEVSLYPISTEEYPTLAKRPAYSVLSNEKIRGVFGITLPSWDKSLKMVLDE